MCQHFAYVFIINVVNSKTWKTEMVLSVEVETIIPIYQAVYDTWWNIVKREYK